MAESYIVIERSPERDPDGSRLRDVLQAPAALERAESLRVLMVYFVALFSVPNSILALWRDVLPQVRALLFAAWAASVVGVILAGVSEWGHRRRRREVMAELASGRASGP